MKSFLSRCSLFFSHFKSDWRLHKSRDNFKSASTSLTSWYRARRGRSLLESQLRILSGATDHCFGFHAMQLSPVTFSLPLRNLRIAHQFKLHPQSCDCAGALAAFEDLPVAEQSLDFILLHHALDFSFDPHGILRETERALVSKGYVAIVGFNPWSLWGIYSYFARFFSKNPIYRTTRLRLGRLMDWLKLLDLTPVSIEFATFIASPSKVYLDTRLQCVATHSRTQNLIPWGASYIILARKDTHALTPIKPVWTFTKPNMNWALSRRWWQSQQRRHELSNKRSD